MSRFSNLTMAFFVATFLVHTPVHAETIFRALAKAYDNNPDLNAVRAGLRATNEGVAIAKSGYRPKINAAANITRTSTDYGFIQTNTTTSAISVEIKQTLFDGFQTKNKILAAQSSVLGGRENLKNIEMNILLGAAQSYANLIRDGAIVSIRRQNLRFLREQLAAARARFQVGEGTRTDVSQAQAQLAAAKALLVSADAQRKASIAVYVQIIGHYPKNLKAPSPLRKSLPRTLKSALAISETSHPTIKMAAYSRDSAKYNVKSKEGSLLPGVSLNGSLSQTGAGVKVGSVSAQLVIPIYQGGASHALVRQSKELLGQNQILLDSAHRAVRQGVVTAWVQNDAQQAAIAANLAQLRAAKLALGGVVEERNVGQRTTLDVLNAQQSVLNARESLAQSERNAVVASYALLSAVGRLGVRNLGLRVSEYRAEKHYEAVKDRWFGLRRVTVK